MWKRLVFGILLLNLTACVEFDYYLHSITGHLQVVRKQQTISSLLTETTTPAALQEQLKQIVEIRDFASQQLLLPKNGSYHNYADLDRPYVVWNVVATPEFSLQPLQWNFPFVGMVSYRGYFDLNKAKKFAGSLDEDHFDSIIVGVPAYSTLSWFDDPVLSTFSDWPTPAIAELIFHELAHQKLYIPDDTSFNESFATSVALIGIDLWLQNKNDPELSRNYQIQTKRQQQFNDLLRSTRAELQTLYRSAIPPQQMRNEKQLAFANLQENYQQLRNSWQGDDRYDGWFSQLNNARFASTDSYQRWVPAFQQAMKQEGNDLERFYRRCQAIANLPETTRHALLDKLAADNRSTTSAKGQSQ